MGQSVAGWGSAERQTAMTNLLRRGMASDAHQSMPAGVGRSLEREMPFETNSTNGNWDRRKKNSSGYENWVSEPPSVP